MVDIFRPENAGDTLKLFLNWDGMGKLMLDSLVDADNRGTILQAGLFLIVLLKGGLLVGLATRNTICKSREKYDLIGR